MEDLFKIIIIFIIVYIGLLIQSYLVLNGYNKKIKKDLQGKTDEQILDYIYNTFKL